MIRQIFWGLLGLVVLLGLLAAGWMVWRTGDMNTSLTLFFQTTVIGACLLGGAIGLYMWLKASLFAKLKASDPKQPVQLSDEPFPSPTGAQPELSVRQQAWVIMWVSLIELSLCIIAGAINLQTGARWAYLFYRVGVALIAFVPLTILLFEPDLTIGLLNLIPNLRRKQQPKPLPAWIKMSRLEKGAVCVSVLLLAGLGLRLMSDLA